MEGWKGGSVWYTAGQSICMGMRTCGGKDHAWLWVGGATATTQCSACMRSCGAVHFVRDMAASATHRP